MASCDAEQPIAPLDVPTYQYEPLDVSQPHIRLFRILPRLKDAPYFIILPHGDLTLLPHSLSYMRFTTYQYLNTLSQLHMFYRKR